MKNALLEIGCEEIPARFMPDLLADLLDKAEKALNEERLEYSKVKTFGTYRRLALYIENLSDTQKDQSIEQKGPPADIAFKDGKPALAAIGFAKTCGVMIEDLIVKPFNNKNYVFAQINKKGEPVDKLLVKLFSKIITSLYLPLSMRWGNLDFKFIRPIHWILALYGKKTIGFELAGIKASNIIHGHRFFNGSRLKTKDQRLKTANLKEFKELLRKNGVILDQDERKNMIVSQLKKTSSDVLIEDDLLEEVNFLVEYPAVVAGKFKPEYLKLPKDVLITSMKKNQKYFPSVSDGKLNARFLAVTDGSAKKFHDNIIKGNQKVLSARLEDARFFFEGDKKIPLKYRLEELKKVEFFDKLGNMEQKTERIRKLADLIGRRIKLNNDDLLIIDRVAELCKSDLTTQMVFEFPVLQGIMGKEYARIGGELPEVAHGIYEHYLTCPQALHGAIVGLADRIDTLVGCFSLGFEPTGSTDPYALRRAVLDIVSIIQLRRLSLDLEEVIEFSYKLYHPILANNETYKNFNKIFDSIMNFISVRIKNVLLEKGFRYDVIDAVLDNFDDIDDIFLRVKALTKAREEDWFKGVRLSADRVLRISKDAQRDEIREKDLEDIEEKHLSDVYLQINWEVEELINKDDYSGALLKLNSLTRPINAFFDKVMVMHKDERLKANRLALLKAVSNLYLKIANFGKIV